RMTIERATLLKSLTHVQSIVERRTTIPILSNVMLKASAGQLRLTATDLDIEIVESVAAEISSEGETTAPAHLMHDIVRKLPDGSQLDIEQGPDDGRLSILAGRSRFTLQTLPPDDFPDLSASELEHNFTIAAGDLKMMIDKTRFAISTEETRYYLNGIYLHSTGDDGDRKMRAVATDGHRLARVEIASPVGAEEIPGVIIPRKTVLEVIKLIGDEDGEIEIGLSEAKIRFSFNGLVLTSKLIDGTFPDYERVIPMSNDKMLTVDRRLFSQAVDRVSTVSADKGRAIKLSISPDRVILTVNNPDSGTAEEELAATYASEPIDVGFNSQYLLDIASQLDGDTANFLLLDSGSPTIVSDTANPDVLYVLMPMRV
ncbi:MAG TPA: DNA polymerase III subunit beta, partial [Rhodobacteraceae bacterium]|nr:DNA polymerase III subunit beta [Paracoccaceae bacterium]